MEDMFSRTAMVLGEDNIKRLNKSRVAVFGLGGVGGYVVEALARCGVGTLDLIDGDKLSLSNLNRQILALHETLGMPKCEAAKRRVKQINPDICANERNLYFNTGTQNEFDFGSYDYVVDAIDTVTDKLLLAKKCRAAGVKEISCMGTGNKLDPMGFKVADIHKTKGCPLARVMRRLCKEEGIESLKVVYSEERPSTNTLEVGGRHAPGSVAFVPAAAGMLIAAEVIKDLCKRQ